MEYRRGPVERGHYLDEAQKYMRLNYSVEVRKDMAIECQRAVWNACVDCKYKKECDFANTLVIKTEEGWGVFYLEDVTLNR